MAGIADGRVMKRRSFILVLVAGLMFGGFAASGPTLADDKLERDFAKDSGQRNRSEGHYSLDYAVSVVRQRYGGEVLSATTRGNDHYVKILTENGRVKTVTVDSRTGQMR